MELVSLQIGVALLLDGLLGDPPSWPHPVRWIGRLAAASERWCRRLFGDTVTAGGCCVLLVLLVTGTVTAVLLAAAGMLHPYVRSVAAVLVLYTCFALRDLLRHSRRVHAALAAGDLEAARRRVAMIVGRDTADLDTAGVVRACVESVAENMVDGVTAPLFYAFIGGPVGAMLYKAVNTMDSMFGYRNDRYEKFGRIAARLDDAANFIPARLTGLVIVLAALLTGFDWRRSWRIFLRDRLAHKSPNSAHSEAAAAGALGVQLGGSAVYFGRMLTKPTIGDATVPLAPSHILMVNRLAVVVTAVFWLLAAVCLV